MLRLLAAVGTLIISLTLGVSVGVYLLPDGSIQYFKGAVAQTLTFPNIKRLWER